METSGISFQIIEQNRKKLQDLRQGDVGNYKGAGKLETFTGGRTFQVQNLDRSQELGILYEGAEAESQTSTMGILPVKIRLHSEVCTRNKNGEGR